MWAGCLFAWFAVSGCLNGAERVGNEYPPYFPHRFSTQPSVYNSSSDALSISFAVLNSRIAGKVGRVSARKVCGFQAALRLICRVGTCCPRVVLRQPETARATGICAQQFLCGAAICSRGLRFSGRLNGAERVGSECPPYLPHRFSTQPALKGGGNGGGCVIGVIVV